MAHAALVEGLANEALAAALSRTYTFTHSTLRAEVLATFIPRKSLLAMPARYEAYTAALRAWARDGPQVLATVVECAVGLIVV